MNITQERKLVPFLLSEGFQGEWTVDTYSNHLSVQIVQIWLGISERAHLLCADRTERQRKESQDNIPFSDLVSQILILQIHVR